MNSKKNLSTSYLPQSEGTGAPLFNRRVQPQDGCHRKGPTDQDSAARCQSPGRVRSLVFILVYYLKIYIYKFSQSCALPNLPCSFLWLTEEPTRKDPKFVPREESTIFCLFVSTPTQANKGLRKSGNETEHKSIFLASATSERYEIMWFF